MADAAGAVKRPAGDAPRVEGEGERRLWAVLLTGGGLFAGLLLVRQLLDIEADAGHPALRQNDIYSALGSVAMLAIVGVIAARREQVRRENAAAAGKPALRGGKRAAAARRKGRA